MVTIEQKLTMFSKLLHRSMNEKHTEKMDELKKTYKSRFDVSRAEVDKEATDIVSRAYKMAEAEKTELFSKISVSSKRKYMETEERLFNTMLAHLTDKIKGFMDTDEYGEYLLFLAKKLSEEEPSSASMTIIMTGADYKRHGERIKEQLLCTYTQELIVEATQESILGGFVAVDSQRNIRMDFSIKTLFGGYAAIYDANALYCDEYRLSTWAFINELLGGASSEAAGVP